MKQLKVIFFLIFLCSNLDVKIQASYYGFFCYADRDNDGQLTMKEWNHPNKAWVSEFGDLYQKINKSESLKKEIEQQGHITLEQFKYMSIPGGNHIENFILDY